MKFILILSVLILPYTAQAIIVCPEIFGSYTCGEESPVQLTVWQYENNDNVMIYEMFNNTFTADGIKYLVLDNQNIKIEKKAECDYEKLHTYQRVYNKSNDTTSVKRDVISRLSPSKFLYETVTTIIQSPYPDRDFKREMTCKLN